MGGNWEKFRLEMGPNRIHDRKSWWNSNWDARRTIAGWKFVTNPCNWTNETCRTKRKKVTDTVMTKGNAGKKKALYHCNYCQRDISHSVRIKCAECADFDLCLECFSIGVELYPHSNTHAYRVVDNISFPLFVMDWGADEELLMLEAIEMYGLNNWPEVAEHVGTKTSVQCREHYINTYINVSTFPLPDLTRIIGPEGGMAIQSQPTEEETGPQDGLQQQHAEGEGKGTGIGNKSSARKKGSEDQGQDVKVGADGASGRGISRPPTLDSEEPSRVAGNLQEVSGYHAKRNEFDPDFDIDAEVPLAEMDFKESDTEEETRQKERQLEIYSYRLDERERRKNFILERGLLNIKHIMALDKKRTPEERALHAQFRVFARFQSEEDHRRLMEGLAVEEHLRARIEKLKQYRRLGLHTLPEVDAYEADAKRRDFEKQRLKAMESAPYLQSSSIKPPGVSRADRYLARSGAEEGTQKIGPSIPSMQKRSSSAELLALQRGTGGSKQQNPLLDISLFPGHEVLTAGERELCAVSRIMPAEYLSMKRKLMLESREKGSVDPSAAIEFFQVDQVKTLRVFEFLVKCGWIVEAT